MLYFIWFIFTIITLKNTLCYLIYIKKYYLYNMCDFEVKFALFFPCNCHYIILNTNLKHIQASLNY